MARATFMWRNIRRALAEGYGLPAQKKIKSLSKGTRAKVSLSLALAHDPELLVLDEPTSGLDAVVRREFLESMIDRAALGKTVFLCSHQIAEVERVADRVAILHEGKLVLVARLDELLAQFREITCIAPEGVAVPENLPGDVVSQRRRARQWKLMLRSGADECVAALENNPAIESVEAARAELEVIKSSSRTCNGAEASRPRTLRRRQRYHERNDFLADCMERIPGAAEQSAVAMGLFDFRSASADPYQLPVYWLFRSDLPDTDLARSEHVPGGRSIWPRRPPRFLPWGTRERDVQLPPRGCPWRRKNSFAGKLFYAVTKLGGDVRVQLARLSGR